MTSMVNMPDVPDGDRLAPYVLTPKSVSTQKMRETFGISSGSDPLRIIIGVDPGLNGNASDEAHCAFLIKGKNIGILGGQVVESAITDHSLTPLAQMMRLATMIKQVRKYVKNTLEDTEEDHKILLVVERNMVATAGPVYRQVLHLLREGAAGVQTGTIIFVPDMAPPDDEEPKPKRPFRLSAEGRLGVWTSAGSKQTNTDAYMTVIRTHNEGVMTLSPNIALMILPPASDSHFQLSGVKLMQVVESQRKNFALSIKTKKDGVIQHNDMYMVFTFTLAWVHAFAQKLADEQKHFLGLAEMDEQRAGKLIVKFLTTSKDNEEVHDDAENAENTRNAMDPMRQFLSPIPSLPINMTVKPPLNLVRGSRACDSFVAIAGIRFAAAFYMKRSCSLIRRIILERVLVDGWREPAGYAVHTSLLKPRTKWKQLLLENEKKKDEYERIRDKHSTLSVALHWRRLPPATGVWWRAPPAAGCMDELEHLCNSVDQASKLARSVVKEHHAHHPQYGTTRHDLTVFSRLLQTCAQRLHRLSLTFATESPTRKIRTDAEIRKHVVKANMRPPASSRTLDEDYGRTYFCLLAYSHALSQPISHLRTDLVKILTEPDTQETKPYSIMSTQYPSNGLELRAIQTRRIPYHDLCKLKYKNQPEKMLEKIKAQTKNSPQVMRCSIVMHDA